MNYFYVNDIPFDYDSEFLNLDDITIWKNQTPLIEWCQSVGITIPHYCYHKKLSVAGNCRMCLVELKKSAKPLVSCSINAKSSLTTNSFFYTESPLIKKARENIMEFLLLNHPLDCPICDQGGECDLQDQSLFFGATKQRFYNYKRIVTNKNLGPVVKTVMTRCIHCTRCVRFSSEIAGNNSLGTFGRGTTTEIGTYVNSIFDSELSGNVIDICPVGALTLKPYPFVARSWELKKTETIDLVDSFGLKIQVYTKKSEIVKILPSYDLNTNHNYWINNKTRFSFESMFSPQRNFNRMIITGSKTKNINNWNTIFLQISSFIYFLDHLNARLLKILPLYIIVPESIDMETIMSLTVLKKSYKFIKLRSFTQDSRTFDFELNSQISNIDLLKKYEQYNHVLLFNLNLRFESSYLNLILKERFNKGNFSITQFGNTNDMTIPSIAAGLNISFMKSMVCGNLPLCKNLSIKKYTAILGASTIRRYDSTLFKKFNNLLQRVSNGNISLLHSSLNSFGVLKNGSIKTLSLNDLSNSGGLYFINPSVNESNIKILTNMILLNYYTNFNKNKTLIIQSDGFFNKYNIPNNQTVIIPTKNFFETNNTYINTTGVEQKTNSVLPITHNLKNNWEIVRKFAATLNNIKMISEFSSDKNINFEYNNSIGLKNFFCLLYQGSLSLSKTASIKRLNKENQKFFLILNKFKSNQNHLYNTLLKKHLNDFYLDGHISNIHSLTLNKCSNINRLKATNSLKILET